MNGFTMAHSTDANIAYSSPFFMLIESSLVKSGAKIRLSFELKIKPAFESGEFLLADCDFTLIRRTYRYRYFSVEVGFGMVYGIDAQDNLPVGTEEAVGIQLFGKLIQREAEYMFLIVAGNGKGHFVLRIKISYIADLQRPETVGAVYEETGAVLLFFGLQGIQQSCQIVVGTGIAALLQVFVFINGFLQTLLIYRLQGIVDAVDGESTDCILVVSGGKDDGG